MKWKNAKIDLPRDEDYSIHGYVLAWAIVYDCYTQKIPAMFGHELARFDLNEQAWLNDRRRRLYVTYWTTLPIEPKGDCS